MRLFGIEFGKQSSGEERLEIASSWLEKEGDCGLTRHYNAQGVQDSIEQFAGVEVSTEEAIQLVQDYRANHGQSPRKRESFFW